jgi:branched-chain amino acid transport system ATP-binding protein
VLKVDHITAFYGDVQALKDVSLEINAGQVVALLGPNAAGKTTTLRSASAVVKIRSGSISLDGKEISRLAPEKIVNLGLVHVPEGRGIFSSLRVRENLMLGAYTRRARPHIRESLGSVFELFPVLRERETQQGGSLSGGEQQMCAIGRGLMAKPRLLMIDELSLGLAPFLVTKMFDTLAQIAQRGVTVLLVEQQVHRTLELANFGFILENGRTVLSGTSADLAGNEHVKKVYLGM